MDWVAFGTKSKIDFTIGKLALSRYIVNHVLQCNSTYNIA